MTPGMTSPCHAAQQTLKHKQLPTPGQLSSMSLPAGPQVHQATHPPTQTDPPTRPACTRQSPPTNLHPPICTRQSAPTTQTPTHSAYAPTGSAPAHPPAQLAPPCCAPTQPKHPPTFPPPTKLSTLPPPPHPSAHLLPLLLARLGLGGAKAVGHDPLRLLGVDVGVLGDVGGGLHRRGRAGGCEGCAQVGVGGWAGD